MSQISHHTNHSHSSMSQISHHTNHSPSSMSQISHHTIHSPSSMSQISHHTSHSPSSMSQISHHTNHSLSSMSQISHHKIRFHLQLDVTGPLPHYSFRLPRRTSSTNPPSTSRGRLVNTRLETDTQRCLYFPLWAEPRLARET